MKIGKYEVKIFKIKNRKGYAAICCGHLTEGNTAALAYERLVKAMRRTSARKNKFVF
ncbi:MAG: hypothetical protein NC914_01885 [Candidatus Omnitrophica bacterium]|nr:hypothetical protein [Candidatus Omnitrophota bacterium]